jgi:hypothetical protein
MSSDPGDTMRERAGASRGLLWVLVEAPRRAVVAGLTAVVVVSLVVVGTLTPDPVAGLGSGDPIETLFQALVGGTITGVTLVVTLNQLVLSQELGAVGDQRERMDAALSFRSDAADAMGDPVSAPEPSAFLRDIVERTGERAGACREALGPAADDDLRGDVEALADAVAEDADRVGGRLSGAQFGTFSVLSAALDFNYSLKVYDARRIRAEHDLPEELADELDALVELLELFGPAREHFKTLYFQWELVDLSRTILAAAVPSLVVSAYMVLYYDPTGLSGSAAGLPLTVVAIALAVGVALLPFAVLLAYILRIATVAKRTLSIGPFTLRSTARDDGVDGE